MRRTARTFRRHARALARVVEWRLSGRTVFEGVLLGLAAGATAALFVLGLDAAGALVRLAAGGAAPPHPFGEEMLFSVATRPPRIWLLVLFPALGGLVSGLLARRFAPEAEGIGTDNMIDSFHHRGGEIAPRVPVVKGLASIAVLATGGSSGREGPIIQMGAGIGVLLARVFGLSPRRRRVLFIAGAAGAIGAIFRAPLSGPIVAMEVLYREDFETEALVPSILSSVSAYALFTHFFGHETIFRLVSTPKFDDARKLVGYALVGAAAGIAASVFIRLFRAARALFARLPGPPALRPAAGGLLVGLLGLAVPEVLGTGWGYLQSAISGEYDARTLLVIGLGKAAATAGSIGSGGSGGVFGPILVMGAMLGGTVGHGIHAFAPVIAPDAAACALVGMAAFFAGAANAPVGTLLMVVEMTGAYGLVVPLMTASIASILVKGESSIFEHQVRTRLDSPAHREDFVRDALGEIRVQDLLSGLREAPAPLPPATPIGEVRRRIELGDFPFALVAGTDGVHSIVLPEHALLAGSESAPILAAIDAATPVPIVRPDDDLRAVLTRLLRARVDHCLVAARREGESYRVLSVAEIEEAGLRFLESAARA